MNNKAKNIYSSFFYMLTAASAVMSAVIYLYEFAFLKVSTNFFMYDHIVRDFMYGFADAFLIFSVTILLVVNKKKNKSVSALAAALSATLVKNVLRMFIDTWFQRGTAPFFAFSFAVFAVWAAIVGYLFILTVKGAYKNDKRKE